MPAVAPDVRVHEARVHLNRPCGDDAFVLGVTLPEEMAPLRAGRFFMLRRKDELSPEIPRPFSVYRQTGPRELEFLVKIHGRGTRALHQSRAGDVIVTIGPLGLGWPDWQANAGPKWFVAGGIGSAPFMMGIEQAIAAGVPADQITYVYGGRTKGFLYDLDLFTDLGVRVIAATDDGSAGFHGNVVQACEHLIESEGKPERVQVFTCGPDPMMKAVVAFADRQGFESWVSLETYMGCGVGICNGCAVGTTPEGQLADWPVAKCCTDGPVFRASDIRF